MNRHRRVRRAGLGLVLVAALALRLPGVSDSALVFHPVRQYPGLAVAKARYLAWAGSAQSAEVRAAEVNGRSAPKLEPRIIESVVALAYLALGGERRGLGGVLSSLSWIAGGLLLYLLARRLASALVAGVAAGFHLFIGYGIIASRSIQPDATMVTLMLASLLCIVRHDERPTARRLSVAAVVSAAAVLVKPFSILLIAGVFLALAIRRRGVRAAVVHPETLAFMIIAAVPCAVLALRVATSETTVPYFTQVVVEPALLVRSSFWRGWLRMIDGTVGSVTAVAAVVSVALTRGRARTFMVGALAGYVVFGLVFTYTIHTHDYYQLPFIPVVGLGVGLTVEAVIAWGRHVGFGRPVAVVAVLVAAAFVVSFASSAVVSARPPDHAAVQAAIDRAERIGELVAHSTDVVLLSTAHGWPLRYHGGVAGPEWPHEVQLSAGGTTERRRDAEGRLRAMIDDGAEWFVITELAELERQPELAELLSLKGQRVVAVDDLVVYDLTP